MTADQERTDRVTDGDTGEDTDGGGAAGWRYSRLTAVGYDLLSGEWPFYRPGRLAAVAGLRLASGDVVLDLGCGTGLSFEPVLAAVGPTGRVVGVDASGAMRARAAHRADRLGAADRVALVGTDLADPDLAAVRRLLPDGRADAVLACYALSLVSAADRAWEAVLALVRPGGRVAVAGLGLPTRTRSGALTTGAAGVCRGRQ